MKLLEFALLSVCDALKQDLQRKLLVEKNPPIQNYDFNSSSVELGQPPFPNLNDDYPHIAKEKVLESANKIYNELIKGLVDTTIFTAVWNR
jgi:hypothetical protein